MKETLSTFPVQSQKYVFILFFCVIGAFSAQTQKPFVNIQKQESASGIAGFVPDYYLFNKLPIFLKAAVVHEVRPTSYSTDSLTADIMTSPSV